MWRALRYLSLVPGGIRQAILGSGPRERQNCFSLDGALILWWCWCIQGSPCQAPGWDWQHMDLIAWASAWGAWGRGAGGGTVDQPKNSTV